MNQEAAAEIWVEEQDDDFVLSELDDTELVEQMHDDLYDGLKDEIIEGTQLLLSRGWAADKVLNEALVGGAPLNEEFGMAVGADAYCRDAAEAADTGTRLARTREIISA
jgi:methanogenic corrinoid protein MtbC1